MIPQSRGIFGTIPAPYRHETPLGLRMHHKTHGGERIAITPLIGPLTDIRLNRAHGVEASCRRGKRFGNHTRHTTERRVTDLGLSPCDAAVVLQIVDIFRTIVDQVIIGRQGIIF